MKKIAFMLALACLSLWPGAALGGLVWSLDGVVYSSDGTPGPQADLGCLLDADRDWTVSFRARQPVGGDGGYAVFLDGADGDAGARQIVVASRFVKVTARAGGADDWRVNFSEPGRGRWHHYAVVWKKRGTLAVFIDGTLQGEDDSGLLAPFCPENVPVFGGLHFRGKTIQPLRGEIRDARIYDHALDAAAVRSLAVVGGE